jgi:hypothetical protein
MIELRPCESDADLEAWLGYATRDISMSVRRKLPL